MTKYDDDFKVIRDAQAEDRENKPDRRAIHFDLKVLNGSLKDRVFASVSDWVLRRFGLRLMQRFSPVRELAGITFVTRYDDVVKVLNNHEAFNVPFGPEMEEMAGGTLFALGDDGATHQCQSGIMAQAMERVDIEGGIRPHVRRVTQALLEDSGGEIDVARDLFMRITSEACLDAFGIQTEDALEFADYSAACSAVIFGDPAGKPERRAQAMIGARRKREILEQNIRRYAALSPKERVKIQPKTVLGAMVEIVEARQGGALDSDGLSLVRTMLFGIITGFVPTAALGAGKLIDYLRKHPERFRSAVSLACDAERKQGGPEGAAAKAKLDQFLMEVARFNPSLFPGQFRIRNVTDQDPADLPAHLKAIKHGQTMMVSSAIALHDPRRMRHPHRFNPEEGYETLDGKEPKNLTFGEGIHYCFGDRIARAMLTESIQLLLSRPGIKFTGKRPTFAGPYIHELRMRFDPEVGHREQSTLNAVLPLAAGADVEALVALLGEMQGDHRNQTPLKQGLTRSDIVHFASLNPVHLGEEEDPGARPTHLLVEMHVDGSPYSAIRRLAAVAGEEFDALLPFLENPEGSFLRLLQNNLLDFKTLPWGTIGLQFAGTADSSVRQIAQEQALYKKIEHWREEDKAPDPDGTVKDQSPTAVIARMRDRLRQDDDFARLLFRPSDRFPAFSRHEEKTFDQFWRAYFSQRHFKVSALVQLAVVVLATVLAGYCAGVWFGFGAFVTAWLAPALIVGMALVGFILVMLRRERVETPDDRFAEHDYQRAVQAMEDLPHYSQNHITAVSTMKRGFFRKLTTALAFHLIGKMAQLWFRPGFVTDFATIHYAHWVRPKGCNKLIFQSNYDGSWESYLEDFVTKVHRGQTLAWNNCKGFPRTNWLSFDGASDGDQFKRWVRRQQIVTRFWYSRFPDMTTGMIRTNALVRDGLARARSFDEHRAWENLFAMSPRPGDAIETEQVQTLLFHGLGRHPLMTARMLRFEDVQQAKIWLGQLVDESRNAEERGSSGQLHLSFGDSYPNFAPAFVALSAQGLGYLGMPDGPFDGLPTMPHAFVDAMGRRGRILGDDATPADPRNWRWSDAETDGRGAVHAILLTYVQDKAKQDVLEQAVDDTLEEFQISCVQKISADIGRRGRESSDAFGFRDGISQPIMRGTQAFAMGKATPDDVVGPGEFILGYPDSRGYRPLGITVTNNSLAAGLLPATEPTVSDLVPSFGRDLAREMRDFGRNGSFLAIRQMLHNEQAFDAFVTRSAETVLRNSGPYSGAGVMSRKGTPVSLRVPFSVLIKQDDELTKSDISLSGGGVLPEAYEEILNQSRGGMSPEYILSNERVRQIWAKEWVAAKLIGRWKDGSSLARHPAVSRTIRNRARYHNKVRAELERIRRTGRNDAVYSIQRDGPLILSDAARDEVAEFLDLMGTVASYKGEADRELSMNETVWTRSGWEVFLAKLKRLETLTGALDLPQALLRPVVPDNDFRHGTEDPQGLYCPIGSHIRRSNPRDSFRPGHAITLEINNRHRLLRRGRTYVEKRAEADRELIEGKWQQEEATGDTRHYSEEGTLFMCFNANLERQFEFVQQTWVNSKFFHGGRHGPDPIVTPKAKGDRFIIPGQGSSTSLDLCPVHGGGGYDAPEDFTRTVAGGYFFMPGRQALAYLSRI